MSAPSKPGVLTKWGALRKAFPAQTTTLMVLFVISALALGFFLLRLQRYRGEVARLRASMTEAERKRADMVVAAEENRFAVMMELVRRQAQGDRQMHLSVAVDSGVMLFERDGVVLRRMEVHVGGDQLLGVPPDTTRVLAPRGARSISRILGARDAWEVPKWVFSLRQQTEPADRRLVGVLGRNAVLLTGGIVMYALPDTGLFADSSFVLPGAVRVSRSDLRAIAPNLSPGMSVYFYE